MRLGLLAVATGIGAAALVVLVQGCVSCNLAGCEDGFWVDIESRCWTDGSYMVSGAADDLPFAFELVLPVSSGPGTSTVLRGGSPPHPEAVELEISGEGFRRLWFAGTPKVVEIRIQREEHLVLDERLSPSYERFRPNGEECDPVCMGAGETVVVAEPEATRLCGSL